MKITVRIIQIIVGVLFIVSGLVKANDPMGLGYKMEEFFGVWNESLATGNFFAKSLLINLFNSLNGHSLFLSVIMITLEIVAGVALLIGWKKKGILYLLLILTVFFTFLTGYAYLAKNPNGSPKFTNCGCFGDCLPITPILSFLKDLVLLGMIVFLLIGQKYIQPLFSSRTRAILLTTSLFLSLYIQWYVLNYLPLVDCLPFKKGNNIAEQMKPPPGSVPDSIAIRFIYEKNGKQFEFAPENLPADFDTYTFKERIDKLVRKGNAEPKMKGFSLMGTEQFDSLSGNTIKADSTNIILAQSKVIIGFGLDTSHSKTWLSDFRKLVGAANQKNIPVYFASNNREKFIEFFQRNKINIQVFWCTFTNIRTAARTDPTLYILQSGTVQKKYSYRNTDEMIRDL